MMNLSDRLQKIADNISRGETMADIGTDHGFLPIYLFERKISPKVIMADISGPSLEKARRNFAMLQYTDTERVFFREGGGLSVLEPSEVDDIVIAGMGGKLIIEIMAADICHTCSFKKFILQPRIGQGHLRKWLLENGFAIIDEALVREGKYIPEIITALPPGTESERDIACQAVKEFGLGGKNGEDMMYRIPPWIIKASGPVEEFLIRNMENQKKKLENVMLSRKRNLQLEETICNDIAYLKRLLEEIRDGNNKKASS